MKNIIHKNTLFGIVIGIILCCSIVYGTNIYQSDSIEYSPTDASWEVSNVNDALNDLYNMKMELDNIKNIGDATAAQILSGKKAVVKGNTVTGTMIDNGAWTNTPTSSGKVTIPVGYHNGSGYVDTSSVYEAVSGKLLWTCSDDKYYTGSVSLNLSSYSGVVIGVAYSPDQETRMYYYYIPVGSSGFVSNGPDGLYRDVSVSATGVSFTSYENSNRSLPRSIYGVLLN